MMGKEDKLIEDIKGYAAQDKDILCVYLFGSSARGEKSAASDVDICLVLNKDDYSPLELSRKKLEYQSMYSQADIQVFQQLPIYIRVRVLKEGKIVLCKDEDSLYNLAFSVITEYSDFEHILREYLDEVANA